MIADLLSEEEQGEAKPRAGVNRVAGVYIYTGQSQLSKESPLFCLQKG